jgi:hypothetical protein
LNDAKRGKARKIEEKKRRRGVEKDRRAPP